MYIYEQQAPHLTLPSSPLANLIQVFLLTDLPIDSFAVKVVYGVRGLEEKLQERESNKRWYCKLYGVVPFILSFSGL
jgi:hypothetical protein